MTTNTNHTVLIVYATNTEGEALREALQEEGFTFDLNYGWSPDGSTGHLKEFNGRVSLRCVVVGIGEGNDPLKTQGWLRRVKPNIALFCGTGGSLKSATQEVGYTVVADKVYWYNATQQEIIREGNEPLYPCDAHLVNLAKNLTFNTGEIVSGPNLTTDMKHLKKIQGKRASGLVLEMEGGGFMAACKEERTPATVVRSVMDSCVNRDKSEIAKNRKKAAANAAAVATKLVEEWAGRIVNELYPQKIRATKQRDHTENDVTNLVKGLLDEVLGVDGKLEVRVEVIGNKRIDLLFPGVIIEVEKSRDLFNDQPKLKEGTGQLTQYLGGESGEVTPVGLLTDGIHWISYVLSGDTSSPALEETGRYKLLGDDSTGDGLKDWLQQISSTKTEMKPTPKHITDHLGSGSSAHKADMVTLTKLWNTIMADGNVASEANLKRSLWARSMGTAIGTQFVDKLELFMSHTYLVLLAELVANDLFGVLGESDDDLTKMVTGARFNEITITGLVDQDFFDWPLHNKDGLLLIRRMSRRVRQFKWDLVDHDVLKVLYHSVISKADRKAMGEYYTPDWLAKKVVAEVVDNPLEQSVLDPSCGSGTFLFHSVRQYLEAAEKEGKTTNRENLVGVTQKVIGFDLHPVAVILAKTTYLLAVGLERLQKDRGPVTIPVYFADSLRWGTPATKNRTEEILDIEGDEEGNHFKFPFGLLKDHAKFEKLLTSLTNASKKGTQNRAITIKQICKEENVENEYVDGLGEVLEELRRLVDEGRDGIWHYYIRNHAKPTMLSTYNEGVDRIVGNPPWITHNNMSASMQEQHRKMSVERGISPKVSMISKSNLAALFVARCVELYLNEEGRFGMVLPQTMLQGGPGEKFRQGCWSPKDKNSETILSVEVALSTPWKLGKVTEFPVKSCVVFGKRTSRAKAMPPWQLNYHRPADRSFPDVLAGAQRTRESVPRFDTKPKNSEYAARFVSGATIYPIVLSMVKVSDGPMGAAANMVSVESYHGTPRRAPWADVDVLRGTVDSKYVFTVRGSSSVLPYRLTEPRKAVLPIETTLNEEQEQVRVVTQTPDMGGWWNAVSQLWAERSSGKIATLTDQFNYQGKLAGQLPVSPLRVMYAASGKRMAAAVLTEDSIVDSKAYWASVDTLEEANFLVAVLNSGPLLQGVIPYLSGWDFHKHIFVNPIPIFDPTNETHQQIAKLGAEAAIEAETIVLKSSDCSTNRETVRVSLEQSGITEKIDRLVAAMFESAQEGVIAPPRPAPTLFDDSERPVSAAMPAVPPTGPLVGSE